MIGKLVVLAIFIIVVMIAVPFFEDQFVSVQGYIDRFIASIEHGNTAEVGDRVCDLVIEVFGELDYENQDARTTPIGNPFGANLIIFMNEKTAHPEILEYEWRNCYTKGDSSFLSILGGMSLAEKALSGYPEMRIGYSERLSGVIATSSSTSSSSTSTSSSSSSTSSGVDSRTIQVFGSSNSFTLTVTGETTGGKILVDSGQRSVWAKSIDVPSCDILSCETVRIPFSVYGKWILNDVKRDNYNISIVAEGKSINNMAPNEPVVVRIQK